MHAVLFRCRDGARFHFGEQGLDDTSELLHADTLFSALTNVYARAYGDADPFVDHVRAGRLRFSSGLHCATLSWTDAPVFFVPRPPLRYGAYEGSPTAMKQLRRLRYVSLALLRRIGASLEPGPDGARPRCPLDLRAQPRLAAGYACTEDDLGERTDLARVLAERRLGATRDLPHVAVHKSTREDAFYHITSLQMNALRLPGGATVQPHFYALLDHDLPAEAWRRVQACLRLVADEGVGGKRTSGLGQFEGVDLVDIEMANLPDAAAVGDAAWHLTLSPVVPRDDAEFKRAVHYALTRRGGGALGREGDPRHHRKQVRMMREGALFRGPARGRLVDVSPAVNPYPHPVLRSGIALTIALTPSP